MGSIGLSAHRSGGRRQARRPYIHIMRRPILSNSVYGTCLVLAGAVLFAASNAFAAEFLELGNTESSLMFARGTLAWVLNACIAAVNGEQFLNVLLMRKLSRRDRLVLATGAAFNFFCLFSLLIAIDGFIDFGDAFGVLIGTFTISTMALSRALGSSERTTRIEMVGGAVTIAGVLCISQPSYLSRGMGATPSALPAPTRGATAMPNATSAAAELDPPSDDGVDVWLGFLLCAFAGASVGVYNVACRYLAQRGGAVSAACINSGAMLSIGILSCLVLASCTLLMEEHKPPRFAQIEMPSSPPAYGWMVLYCICNTIAQLGFINGVKHIKARAASGTL